VPQAIRFSRPDKITIHVQITLALFAGYTSVVGEGIKQAVAAYIEALPVGQDVITTRLYMPANLFGGEGSETFAIEAGDLLINKTGDPPAEDDIAMAWNETAACAVANVTVITP
jgi:hypothetical protein